MTNDDTLITNESNEQATLGGMLDLNTPTSNTNDLLRDEWQKAAVIVHNPDIPLEERVRAVMKYFLTHFVSLADPNLVDEELCQNVIYDISTSVLQVAIVNPIEEYEKINPVVYGHAILSRIIDDLHGKKMLSLSIYDLLQDWENRYGEGSSK